MRPECCLRTYDTSTKSFGPTIILLSIWKSTELIDMTLTPHAEAIDHEVPHMRSSPVAEQAPDNDNISSCSTYSTISALL